MNDTRIPPKGYCYLEGAELDLLVAKIEKLSPIENEPEGYFYWEQDGNPVSGWYYPSQDWSQGGPLIEKYQIETSIGNSESLIWRAHIINYVPCISSEILANEVGPTPLIAAMRALVASVYGDEIDAKSQ